ncbi:MAG: branched-chain amino acid ABC transporter permease [Actinobacteria bacterium]|nr:branched-chain amino acid ABC transporter permease [Actinomycetota bacterium]
MLNQLLVNGLVMGSAYALIAIGHTMIFGLMGISNFAHGELYMLGGFAAYVVMVQLHLVNYYVGLVLALVIGMGVGALLERLVFRRVRAGDHTTSALVTIGLSIFLANTVRYIWGADPKIIPNPLPSQALHLGSVLITPARLFIIVISIISIFILQVLIQKTKLGKAFRATFQNRDAALLAGIDVNKIYTANSAIGSGLAAMAGALLGVIYTIDPNMGIKAVSIAWIVVTAGGAGSFVGAILAGYLLGVVESFGGGYISSQYKDAVGFIVLILVLLIRPQGFFGKARSQMGG